MCGVWKGSQDAWCSENQHDRCLTHNKVENTSLSMCPNIFLWKTNSRGSEQQEKITAYLDKNVAFYYFKHFKCFIKWVHWLESHSLITLRHTTNYFSRDFQEGQGNDKLWEWWKDEREGNQLLIKSWDWKNKHIFPQRYSIMALWPNQATFLSLLQRIVKRDSTLTPCHLHALSLRSSFISHLWASNADEKTV